MKATVTLNPFLTRHPVMVSGLGLSPLLAPCKSLDTAVAMALVFAVASVLSAAVTGALRCLIPRDYRPVFILLITATIVTILDRYLQVWLFDIHGRLGIYVYLVAMNSLLLAVLEESALRREPAGTMKNVIATAAAVAVILVLAGTVRDLLGQGGAIPLSAGLPVMGSAAGAFLVLGCVLAGLRFLLVQDEPQPVPPMQQDRRS